MLTWSNSDAPKEPVGLAGRRGGGAAAAQGHRISFNLPLQEIFNSRPYDLSVQAARHTFSEVVVEIRENGEEEQVIAVTYMWKCAVSNFKPKLRCPFFWNALESNFKPKWRCPCETTAADRCSTRRRERAHLRGGESSPRGEEECDCQVASCSIFSVILSPQWNYDGSPMSQNILHYLIPMLVHSPVMLLYCFLLSNK